MKLFKLDDLMQVDGIASRAETLFSLATQMFVPHDLVWYALLR